MNHLDVGFDGIHPTIGFAINVINRFSSFLLIYKRYFDVYFPMAVSVAQQLREKGGTERLIYTTHPWLVSIYVDCENANIPQLPQIDETLHCPNATALQDFEEVRIYLNILFSRLLQMEILHGMLFLL